MIASIVFLNVVDAISARTLLSELANSRKTCRFLSTLLLRLAARGSIIVLFTCLAFMPGVFVDDTHSVVA
jgi:hypothetical protein